MLIRKMMLLIIAILFFTIINCYSLCELNAKYEVDGLAGDNSIVAYEVRCGATLQNYTALTWKENYSDFFLGRGKIFTAGGSECIRIEKITPDTVVVYTDVHRKNMVVEQARGITFIYKWKSRAFFKDDSLKVVNE